MSAVPPKPIDPDSYWEERLSAGEGLDSVGLTALGAGFNRWAYRARAAGFDRALRPLLDGRAPGAILDVGSGTGFYVQRWRRLGATRIVASDLTDVAVRRLAAAHPDLEVVRLDIGSPDAIDRAGLERGSFELISIMDVLFHILEPAPYSQAFANIADLLAPGGRVVFSEDMAATSRQRRIKVTRGADETRRAWREAGLRRVSRAPLFVLMNSPSSGGRRARMLWGRLQRTLARWPALGHPAGALLYPLESALVRSGRYSPSTEIVVCRKPARGR